MFEPGSDRIQSWLPLEARLSSIPTRTCLILLIFVIGLLLLLSGDFGLSWDVLSNENNGLRAYDFYFKGFDAARFRSHHGDIAYGPLADLWIKIAQDFTADPLQRWTIRVFLQALLTFSCLIPVFLIASRVVSNGLALIPPALLVATPVFFGHAFINPKDSIAASGFVWCLWLILYCFEDGRQRRYWPMVVLGVLLGMTASIRYLTAYLLLIVPLVAIILPAQPCGSLHSSEHVGLVTRLWGQITLCHRELAILLFTFAVVYTLSMPVILTDFGLHSYLGVVGHFAHAGWSGGVLYFGHEVSAQHLPWHYVYGYLFVQLPLFYHLFLLTFVGVCLIRPQRMWQAIARLDRRASTTLVAVLAAAVIPFVLILIVRPVLYDGFRHVLFIVPLLCILFYLGFILAIGQIGEFSRGALVALVALCWIQSTLAMRWLHPYEYAYYNPLVNLAGSFELDYWGTSFREIAQRLNQYARENTRGGEKLRVSICGPEPPLKLFLDKDKFEIVPSEDSQVQVALNRYDCMSRLTGPWLFSVERGNMVFAVAAKS